MTDAFDLRVATTDDLHLVEPLWIAVHHRHAETMPELAPYVGDAETWAVRRQLYEELLAKPDTLLLLLVFDAAAAIGYGLAHVAALEDSWIPDTWQTGPWCAGPDPRGATGQRRRDPALRTARIRADLAVPVAVRGHGLTAHRRSRTNR